MRSLVVLSCGLFALPAFAQKVETGAADPLVTVQGFPATGLLGQAATDSFGYSVAGAGDVNGDGYDDLIVGARLHDLVGADAGRAYVYFGGPLADSTPDWILNGAAAGDQFGLSVAGAGDVNGDGFADVIVGAPNNDFAGSNAGRAYVYFGGPTADSVADLILTGAVAADAFGYAVAGAGDLNGDGFSDVAVGARFNDASAVNAGQVTVYYGGVIPNAVADVTMNGQVTGDFFGTSVAGAGDVNGDGFPDLIVGAPYNDGGGTDAGRAYVYYGGAVMNNGVDLTLTGLAANDGFGISVATAHDVNNDGFDDVIVGAPGYDGGPADTGGAFVFFGGATPNNVFDLALRGATANDQFGYSVAGPGDINGDGFADLLVGAFLNASGGSSAGRAYAYFGGSAPNNVADLTVTGAASGYNLGYSVAAAGDLDGDGLPDFAAGAPTATSSNGTSSGRVYVYSNANSGEGIAFWRAFGAAVDDRFGTSVASAGDVNGDGYDDLIIGAPLSDAASLDAGRAYVYFGGPIADANADWILNGAISGDQFGLSVAGAGDVNGDGFADVIVGAPTNSFAGSNAGRAYVYFGGPIADTNADWILNGAAAADQFGTSVASAGDVNGDGYDDIIVGAWLNDAGGAEAGRAYVYFGGATPNSVADLTLTGAGAGDTFGYSVAGAGDVNGDGYADLIVGASGNDAGGSDAGRAYVYFGGSSADNTADLTLTGAALNDVFGATVAGVGDVNGDSYDDLAVGAFGNGAGGFEAGRAYVYFGGSTADATADLTLTGAASHDWFGTVASSGDVNGDGFADLIVGARRNTTAGSNAGRAYLYLGGPNVDSTADLTLTGSAVGDYFGTSLASAGDMNGDGRADVIVGASLNDAAGINAGAAYVYSTTGPSAVPAVTRFADIPGDQGGFMHLEWTRSDRETDETVTQYLVQRSRPAGTGGYAWEPVSTIPATKETRYSLAAATYSDQTGTNSGVTCFRVTAKGGSGEAWHSMVECGASIDNLAPGAPQSLIASASGDGDVLLSVGTLSSPPPDLAGYRITRSADATCDAADPFVGTALDTGAATALLEDDATNFGTDVWYCATAIDVHGNQSGYVGAVSANPAVLAAVKVVLQGAYQVGLPGGALMRTNLENVLPLSQPYGGAPWNYAGVEAINATDTNPANGRPDVLDNNAVVDWVLIEIRSSPSATDGKRAAALLLADGTLLDPSTGNGYASVRPAAPGSYHVVVFHRNHVAAMSIFSIGLSSAAPNPAFDFSLSPSLIYGANAVANLGGLYGLFAGDGNGNGTILADDRQAVWLPTVGQTGYLRGDFNMDTNVLADDRQGLWAPNVGRQSAVPGASLLAATTTATSEKQGVRSSVLHPIPLR